MDYIFVKKSFRVSYPKDPNYMSFSEFKVHMLNTYGLEMDSVGYYGSTNDDIKKDYIPFAVVDKSKAMMFALNNSEYVEKPNTT